MSIFSPHRQPGSRWALEQAKRNLVNNYMLVGVTEEMQEFVMVLEAALPSMFKGATDHFQTGKHAIKEWKKSYFHPYMRSERGRDLAEATCVSFHHHDSGLYVSHVRCLIVSWNKSFKRLGFCLLMFGISLIAHNQNKNKRIWLTLTIIMVMKWDTCSFCKLSPPPFRCAASHIQSVWYKVGSDVKTHFILDTLSSSHANLVTKSIYTQRDVLMRIHNDLEITLTSPPSWNHTACSALYHEPFCRVWMISSWQVDIIAILHSLCVHTSPITFAHVCSAGLGIRTISTRVSSKMHVVVTVNLKLYRLHYGDHKRRILCNFCNLCRKAWIQKQIYPHAILVFMHL